VHRERNMRSQRIWICLGGALCLTAALLAQRVWGQELPPVPRVPAELPKVTNIPLPPPPPGAAEPTKAPVGLPPIGSTTLPPLASIPTTPPAPPAAAPRTAAAPKSADVPLSEVKPGKQEPSVSVEWTGPPAG